MNLKYLVFEGHSRNVLKFAVYTLNGLVRTHLTKRKKDIQKPLKIRAPNLFGALFIYFFIYFLL